MTQEQDKAPDTSPTPQERQRACFEEIREALDKHRCHIVPSFGSIDQVGSVGNKMQIEAVWNIHPEP